MTYWQTVEIDAESKAEAEATALDAFDIKHSHNWEGEVCDIEEIKGESK